MSEKSKYEVQGQAVQGMDIVDALAYVQTGMDHMSQSWRETTVRDPEGMHRTISASWKAIRERRAELGHVVTGLARERADAKRQQEAAEELLETLAQIDLTLIPHEQMARIIKARSALQAATRRVGR